MRLKKFSIFLISILPAFSVISQSVEIYYTSSLNGNLDGCECRSVPRAGIVRTAPFIRQRDPAALFFDLGDSFDVYADNDLHHAIQSSYISLGLDSSALGDQEFVEGVDWVKNSSYPYLANNIKIDGKEFSSRFKIFSVDGINIALAAVIDPEVFVFSPEKIRKRLEIMDPLATSRILLGDMEAERVDVKILLYHGSLEKAVNILEIIPGWDVVLVGHEQRLTAEITAGKPRFLGSPGDNGNRVGVLKIIFKDGLIDSFQNQFHYFDYWDDPKDPYIDSLLQEYRRSMTKRLR